MQAGFLRAHALVRSRTEVLDAVPVQVRAESGQRWEVRLRRQSPGRNWFDLVSLPNQNCSALTYLTPVRSVGDFLIGEKLFQ